LPEEKSGTRSPTHHQDKSKEHIRPDGVVKTSLRLDFGYWESKANVDLDNEIKKKIKAGYPLTNTLFEDSKKIILYQEGRELSRCSISDATELDNLLNKFISVEPAPVRDFNAAVVRFKKDIPAIVKQPPRNDPAAGNRQPSSSKKLKENFFAFAKKASMLL
jgi:hypothetical protein